MRTVDARISVPGIPLGALLRWIGGEEGYGPRKRSPLKWMRCVGLSAHHTSVSHAMSVRYLRISDRDGKQETYTRLAVEFAKSRPSSPWRCASTGPCEDAASSSTSQCLSRRYTTRSGILPCSSTKTPSSARPVSSNPAHFELASATVQHEPARGEVRAEVLDDLFEQHVLAARAERQRLAARERHGDAVHRASGVVLGLQPGHISEIRGEHCLKLAGTRFADHVALWRPGSVCAQARGPRRCRPRRARG